MRHVFVLKAAYHVHDEVHLADVAEELVAQSFPLGGTFHEPRNVHELDGRRRGVVGVGQFGEAVEAVVRNWHHAHVGLDGAEGIVLGIRAGITQRIEDGRLSDVGQADEAALQGHERQTD